MEPVYPKIRHRVNEAAAGKFLAAAALTNRPCCSNDRRFATLFGDLK
jgi:hypothetical protein